MVGARCVQGPINHFELSRKRFIQIAGGFCSAVVAIFVVGAVLAGWGSSGWVLRKVSGCGLFRIAPAWSLFPILCCGNGHVPSRDAAILAIDALLA